MLNSWIVIIAALVKWYTHFCSEDILSRECQHTTDKTFASELGEVFEAIMISSGPREEVEQTPAFWCFRQKMHLTECGSLGAIWA